MKNECVAKCVSDPDPAKYDDMEWILLVKTNPNHGNAISSLNLKFVINYASFQKKIVI